MTHLRMSQAEVAAYQKRAANGWQEPQKRGRKPASDKGGPFHYEPAKIVSGALCVALPLKLVSIANAGEHFGERRRRVKAEHDLVNQAIPRRLLPQMPVKVTITRVGPRLLDSDNCTISAKGVRDAIAALYGWDDGSDRYIWDVRQEKGEYGVRVEIASR